MSGKIDKIAAAVELTRMVIENRKTRGMYYFEDDVEKVYRKMRGAIENEEDNYEINSKSKKDS